MLKAHFQLSPGHVVILGYGKIEGLQWSWGREEQKNRIIGLILSIIQDTSKWLSLVNSLTETRVYTH